MRGGRVSKATFGDIQGARNAALDNVNGVGPEWAKTVYGNFIATSVPAYRAVTARGRAVRSAPLQVMSQRGDEAQPTPDSHPAQRLLTRVNRWWSAGDLLETTEIYLSLWGSCFWFLDRGPSGRGRPTSIWPLRPDRIRIIPGEPSSQGQFTPDDYISGFVFEASSGRRQPLTVDEVVWFRYINPLDEYAGLSPVAPARLSLEMGQSALTFNSSFFKNGAMPGDVVFSFPGPLTDDEVNDFRKRLKKRHGGAENAHEPMIADLSQGLKAERLGLTQRDMEFMASLQWTVEDAARVWGVPPPMLMSEKQSTYNNVREARIQFYVETVSEEWSFLSQEINELLMPMFGEDLFVQFDTSGILPLKEAMTEMDAQDLEEVKNGTLTINEYRQRRGRDPVEWGDVWHGPAALRPIADAEPPAPMAGSSAQPDNQGQNSVHPPQHKAIPDAQAERVLKQFDEVAASGEERFRRLMDDLFERQKQETLRRLRRQSQGDLSRWLTAVAMKQGPTEEPLFSVDEWLEPFKQEGGPVLRAVLTTAANQHGAEFGLGGIDPIAPPVAQWVDDRLIFWASVVNEETAAMIVNEVARAVELGESIREIQDRVENVFDFNDAVRSERIARTESIAAANQGHLEVYRQNEAVSQKQWLTSIDGRERATHREANGQTVLVDDEFLVGGERLPAPGQGSIPENNINCRCSIRPIIERRSERQAQPDTDAMLVDAGVLQTALDSINERLDVLSSNRKSHKVHKTVHRDENGEITGVTEVVE